MQAIQTKILPITDKHLDTRIKATCAAKSIVVYAMDNLDTEGNHIYAAKQLMKELNWQNEFYTGQLKDGSFVHILIPKGE